MMRPRPMSPLVKAEKTAGERSISEPPGQVGHLCVDRMAFDESTRCCRAKSPKRFEYTLVCNGSLSGGAVVSDGEGVATVGTPFPHVGRECDCCKSGCEFVAGMKQRHGVSKQKDGLMKSPSPLVPPHAPKPGCC